MPTKLGELRKDFSQSTSCHGLAQVYASTSRIQKAFWCLLVLAVLGVLISQLVTRISEYLAHKTTTSISEEFTDSLDLPAITICNFNHFFGVEMEEEERQAIDELARARADIQPGKINTTKIKYFENVYNGSIRSYTINKGWQLNNDTLIWCYTGNEECTHKDFTYSIGELGKCWTYRQQKNISQAGSRYGISMVFDVQQDQYTETLVNGNWEAGIKVQVHPTYDVPEVDQFGMAVPVGTMAFIGMNKKEESIMYTPWGKCEPDDEELTLYDTYSAPNCFSECQQLLTEKFCKCRLYTFSDKPHLDECSPQNTTDCIVNVAIWLKNYPTANYCDCQPPCKSLQYNTKISYAAIPNQVVQRELGTLLGISTPEFARENLAGITVYYEKMSYTVQEESKAITWSGLLSDLGGQLGLWIGISVVTIFEIAQFLIVYFTECTESTRQKRSQNKGGNTREEDIVRANTNAL